MIPEEFHFIRPEWLFLFIPLVILFGFIWHGRLNKSNWQSVCDIQLLPYLLVDKPTKRNRWPLFWLALGGILAVFALAGPCLGEVAIASFPKRFGLGDRIGSVRFHGCSRY